MHLHYELRTQFDYPFLRTLSIDPLKNEAFGKYMDSIIQVESAKDPVSFSTNCWDKYPNLGDSFDIFFQYQQDHGKEHNFSCFPPKKDWKPPSFFRTCRYMKPTHSWNQYSGIYQFDVMNAHDKNIRTVHILNCIGQPPPPSLFEDRNDKRYFGFFHQLRSARNAEVRPVPPMRTRGSEIPFDESDYAPDNDKTPGINSGNIPCFPSLTRYSMHNCMHMLFRPAMATSVYIINSSTAYIVKGQGTTYCLVI